MNTQQHVSDSPLRRLSMNIYTLRLHLEKWGWGKKIQHPENVKAGIFFCVSGGWNVIFSRPIISIRERGEWAGFTQVWTSFREGASSRPIGMHCGASHRLKQQAGCDVSPAVGRGPSLQETCTFRNCYCSICLRQGEPTNRGNCNSRDLGCRERGRGATQTKELIRLSVKKSRGVEEKLFFHVLVPLCRCFLGSCAVIWDRHNIFL